MALPMFRVRTVSTGVAGSPYYTNTYFQALNTTDSVQPCIDAVTAFWGALVTSLAAGMTINVLPEVPTIMADTGDIVAVRSGNGSTQTTGRSGGRAAPATQGLIRLQTSSFVLGRRIRGKIYVPQVSKNDVGDDGNPLATFVNTMAAAANALRITVSPLVVYSPKNLTYGVVTGQSAWNQFAVLRSRRD